jgi:hypothetical protein
MEGPLSAKLVQCPGYVVLACPYVVLASQLNLVGLGAGFGIFAE